MASDALGRALRSIIDAVHLARAEDLPDLLNEVAPLLGARELVLYLVDYSQRSLVRFPSFGAAAADAIAIDGSLAGRVYRDSTVHRSRHSDVGVVWVPVLDGTERLGVLKVVLAGKGCDIADLTTVASLAAEVLTTRANYGDSVELTRRRLPMSVAAEMQWGLLPPLTFATPKVVISAALEPCYDIGGDSFDYAINGDLLHVALFDAVGHGVEAARVVTLAIAAYRNARRSGLTLEDTTTCVDRWLSQQCPGTFVTGILLELDTGTGRTRVVNAGHPPPLLLRGQRLVRAVQGPTRIPLGLGSHDSDAAAIEVLEPGDRLLLHSDGIVEARGEDGEEFGPERLIDFVARQSAAELSAPETLRRLMHRILDHQRGVLQDDATAVLVQWSSHGPRLLNPLAAP